MSKMKDAKLALEDFIRAGREALDALSEIAGLFRAEGEDEPIGESGDPSLSENEQADPPGTATLEEVRALLAEKARTGYRAEVKALLTAHGAKQLSDITEPTELGAMMKEARKIGADIA